MMGTIDHSDLRQSAGEELLRELRAYAGTRLSPDAHASHRMRVAVLERAQTVRPVRSPFLIRRTIFTFLRAGTMVALVAVLAVGTGATAGLAASPGGPLYGVRLSVEDAFLPSMGLARTVAQVNQIDERVDEAQAAAAHGDAGGVTAALSAFEVKVNVAVRDAGTDPAQLGHVQAAVSMHLPTLQALLAARPRLAAVVERAIQASRQALDQIAQDEAGG